MDNDELKDLKEKMIGKTVKSLNLYDFGNGLAIHLECGESILIKAAVLHDECASLGVDGWLDLYACEQVEAGLITQDEYDLSWD